MEVILDNIDKLSKMSQQYNERTFQIVIVELKAVESLLPQHSAQVINYLKATNKEVGVLLNFGDNSLVHKRFYNFINNSSNP
ncbi:MAG: GxxExxY protein [Bacteroidales bacterium]|nr:GxxExxY protein [Bacteroidales bacterium]